MLVKLTSEQAALIGVTEAKDFAEKFTAFVQESKELKDMAEQSPDFTALEKRVKALEDRPAAAGLTEAQVDSRVDAVIAGDKAKGVIETIASKKLAEAIGATGTTPAKPSPAPAAPPAAGNETFPEAVAKHLKTGMKKTEAISAAITSHPEEYKAWLNNGGGQL